MPKSSFDLDLDVKKQLDVYCQRNNKKKKVVVNDALRAFLNDISNTELLEKIKKEFNKV